MTLGDMKSEVLRLIEEINEENEGLTDDPDFKNKINNVIDFIQHELARIKKIPAIETSEVKEGDTINLNELENFYQLKCVKGVRYTSFGTTLDILDDGTIKIYYYKYPKKINEKSKDNTELELTDDALGIMPYGVAADLLKSDVSNQYGQIYANRYTELKQSLDPRYNTGGFYIDGGTKI